MSIRIFLQDLAEYNNGNLKGEWFDLPNDTEEMLESVLVGDNEEYFITDYEAPFKIDEHDDLEELNEQAEQLDSIDEVEQERVFFLMDNEGLDLEDALDKWEDVMFYDNMTLEDLAYQFVDEGLFGDIADTIKNYIDYEAIARDLGMDGYTETDKGVFHYC